MSAVGIIICRNIENNNLKKSVLGENRKNVDI